jgi:hypothetical protein
MGNHGTQSQGPEPWDTFRMDGSRLPQGIIVSQPMNLVGGFIFYLIFREGGTIV